MTTPLSHAETSPLASPSERLSNGIAFIRELADRGGPAQTDFSGLNALMAQLEVLPAEALDQLRAAFGESLSGTETMQGFAYVKPHGYAGDFEIIDRIYQTRVSDDPRLAGWDRYFHAQPAPRAVRNRKDYFHALLDRKLAQLGRLRVLNVASGPGRCMAEWLKAHPDAAVEFDCVELDALAIDHARRLTADFSDRVRFHQQNALRFTPQQGYDLIWVAGLCDYFTGPIFVRLLRRLLPALGSEGELVAGNFSEANPSRAYMEILGEWCLHHRSADELRRIGHLAAGNAAHVAIGAEPEGVNLFLHLTNTPMSKPFSHAAS